MPIDLEKIRKEALSKAVSANSSVYNNDYIIEPSAKQIIIDLLPKVLCQKIYTVLLDSNASEHAARTMAMQTATDNANDLIQDLTKQYNKSRQQAITNELLDIIGGSMKYRPITSFLESFYARYCRYGNISLFLCVDFSVLKNWRAKKRQQGKLQGSCADTA